MKIHALLLLVGFALPLAAQESSTIGTAEGIFGRLEVKNRSRLFVDNPSPSGQHYVYLDDYNLNSGVGLDPEIRVQPETRGVTTVVHTWTRTRISSAQGDFSIGTVRLLDAQRALRGIQVRTIFDLNQPLEIEVRERVQSNE